MRKGQVLRAVGVLRAGGTGLVFSYGLRTPTEYVRAFSAPCIGPCEYLMFHSIAYLTGVSVNSLIVTRDGPVNVSTFLPFTSSISTGLVAPHRPTV